MGYRIMTKRAPRRYRRKRVIRRKKVYRRRRQKKIFDQMNVKMDVVRSFTYRTNNGAAQNEAWAGMTVNWSSTQDTQYSADTVKVTDCSEWVSMLSSFKQYKITYCKMKLVFSDNSTAGKRWDDLHVASDVGVLENLDAMSVSAMQYKTDYKNFNAGRNHTVHKGVSVQKALRKTDNGGFLAANVHIDSGRTHFRFYGGFGNGEQVATMHVRYYITLRNPFA